MCDMASTHHFAVSFQFHNVNIYIIVILICSPAPGYVVLKMDVLKFNHESTLNV